MQTHSKARKPACTADRIIGSGCPDHEAGSGENTGTACLLHGIVDRLVQAEIIGGDD
jgi:hypothetical protein